MLDSEHADKRHWQIQDRSRVSKSIAVSVVSRANFFVQILDERHS
jgi:hypothetical protein